MPDPDRPCDVLYLVLAAVAPGEVDAVADLPVRIVGDGDASWFGQGFDSGRDIDTVAEQITALVADVADVDADAETDLCVRV